jgi:MFS transporter, SHS family, lactate transporter
MSDSEKPTTEAVPAVGSNPEEEHYPPYHNMSAGEYIRTRFSSLKPPMHKAPNPIKLVMMLNRTQWAFFFVAFIAWVSPRRQMRPGDRLTVEVN